MNLPLKKRGGEKGSDPMPKILLRCNLLAVHTRTALGKRRKGKGTPAFELGSGKKGSDPMRKILLR